MTNAYPEMEKTPPKGGDASGAKPAAHAGSVVDLVIRTTELDEMEDLTNSLISSHRLKPLTSEGVFDSTLQIHGVQDFCGFTISYGRSVEGRLEDVSPDERMAFVMAPKGTGQLTLNRQEFRMSGERGVVFPTGPLKILNHSDDCEISVLLMNRHKAAEQCARLLARDLDQDLQFDTGFDLNSANGQSWVRLFQYATAELANPHSLFRSVAAARQQLEQTVLTGFLLSQTHTYSEALLRPQSAAAPFYVRRAEAFIEAHFSEPLSLADIAAQAGVSARSLQNGFQNFRNMTPMAFLRAVRLQRVHRMLLTADPGFARVTEIALACGFNHMGEFASAYRCTFGETPRETLVRARAG
ncbi:MAG: AraC family transcriptional regulator [Microvirga sp.]